MEKDNINELTIGQLLIKHDYKSVVDIKKTSRNRLIVSFKNKVDANNVIKNVTISKINNIKSYTFLTVLSNALELLKMYQLIYQQRKY